MRWNHFNNSISLTWTCIFVLFFCVPASVLLFFVPILIVFYCQKVKNICPPLKDDVVWQIIVPHRSGINIFPSSLVWPWNIWCKISIKFAVIVVVCVCSWKIKAESNLYCEIERESGSHLVHDWCCWSKYAFFTFSRPFKVVGSRINHCSTKLDVYSSR